MVSGQVLDTGYGSRDRQTLVIGETERVQTVAATSLHLLTKTADRCIRSFCGWVEVLVGMDARAGKPDQGDKRSEFEEFQSCVHRQFSLPES